jgi:uncharacterized protein YoxC
MDTLLVLVTDVKDELRGVRDIVHETAQETAVLTQRVNDLREDIGSVRGEVERMTNELQSMGHRVTLVEVSGNTQDDIIKRIMGQLNPEAPKSKSEWATLIGLAVVLIGFSTKLVELILSLLGAGGKKLLGL